MDPIRQKSRRARRIRSTLIGAGDYVLNIALLGIFYLFDKIDIDVLIVVSSLSVLVNATFIFIVLSNKSASVSNASLTALQISVGCAMNILALAMAPQIAYMFAMNLFIPLAYGSLNFRRSGFILAWVLVTVAMTLAISIFGHHFNTLVIEKSDKFLFILVTSLALGRFLFINAEVSNIRRYLSEKNRALKKAYGLWHGVLSRDDLTGLADKHAFLKILHESSQPILELRKFYIAIVEIDNFEQVNSTYGTTIGRKVVCAVANILSCRLRRNDCVARFDDEQFALLLTQTSLNLVVKALERARVQVEQTHWPYYGCESNITVSVGVAEWLSGEDTTSIIANARHAMHMAKTTGSNKLVIFEENFQQDNAAPVRN